MQANPITEAQPTTQTQASTELEVSYPDDTPAMTEFRTRILNKPVCVTLADQRKVLGKISCIDQQKNLVMIDAIEEIPEQYVAPINEKLPVISRSIMKIKNYITLPEDVASNEEKVKELEEEFFKNKFYLGQAIIPGHCISKLEIQKV